MLKNRNGFHVAKKKTLNQTDLHSVAKILVNNFLDALAKMHNCFIQSTSMEVPIQYNKRASPLKLSSINRPILPQAFAVAIHIAIQQIEELKFQSVSLSTFLKLSLLVMNWAKVTKETINRMLQLPDFPQTKSD